VFAGRMGSHLVADILPAGVQREPIDGRFEDIGFADLAVQSVGFEEGVDNPKVHVYVTKGPRRKEAELEDEQVTVRVNRIGKVVVRPEVASAAAARGQVFLRNNRIACGSSCAPSGENYAGTLGALVRKNGDKDLFVLSNNHVLAAANHTPVGMPILSPSPMDAGPDRVAPAEIGRHEDICELRSGVPALVPPQHEDVAIARVTDPRRVTSWQGNPSDGFDTPGAAGALQTGLRVKKVGRTTGLTRGTVEARLLPFTLPYTCRHFTAKVWFDNVWSVRADPGEPFALPGDSGSLVVGEKGDSALGLLFAVGSQGHYGIIVPMQHVLTLFKGLTLVTNHGL
jgi:hypothetical protein